MTVDTGTYTLPHGYKSGNEAPATFTATPQRQDDDRRVSLYPLSGEDALRGLLMTREIQQDPEQSARLDSARKHASEGAVRWVETEDDLSSDSE